jgi:large subunit ribosomal protein L24
VLSVDPVKATVTVEHASMIKRHTRPNPSKNIKGGILEKEGPIHVSNVMLVCPGCGKHARAGHTTLPDGTKARICRRCNTTLEG